MAILYQSLYSNRRRFHYRESAICNGTPRKGVPQGWRLRLKREKEEKDRLRKAKKKKKRNRPHGGGAATTG